MLKVDIGVHVKGRICDSAFTLNWEPTYDKLIEATKAATNTGVRVSMMQRDWKTGRLTFHRKQALMCGLASSPATSRKPWSHTRLTLGVVMFYPVRPGCSR